MGEGLIAEPVWTEAMMAVIPARHPLMAQKCIPLEEMLRYPLVLCEGHARQVEFSLRKVGIEPLVAERVASCDLMMALVSASFALALTGSSRIAASREPGVLARPLAGYSLMLTTYLLYRSGEASGALDRFIERVHSLGCADNGFPSSEAASDPSENQS